MHFSASNEWIKAAFSQAASSDEDGILRQHSRSQYRSEQVIIWILGYILHDSLETFDHYIQSIRSLTERYKENSILVKLEAISRSSSAAELAKRATGITGYHPSLRRGDIEVRTGSSLSRGFIPPQKDMADRAIKSFFLERDNYRYNIYSIQMRLASYLILLTIHIFKDGNGRLSRLLFASDTLTHSFCIDELLGLIFLHKNKGFSFHLAAKCARAGDFSMLFNCYADMQSFSRKLIIDDLVILDEYLLCNNVSGALQISRNIHKTISSQIRGL